MSEPLDMLEAMVRDKYIYVTLRVGRVIKTMQSSK